MSNDLLKRLFNQLSGAEFEEIPVDVHEFVTSEEYSGLKELSEHQYSLVRAMSQIYKKETLLSLYGDEARADERWRETYREIIMQLGKGSGKDFTSTVAVSYVVYLLLCLKDPALYYDKPKGDSIDIINIAINSDQANRVFFKNFVERIRNNPWFENKFEEKQGSIEFDKNITVYSGHSEREAFEGYNTLLVILDEISGFALESSSGNQNAKTAPAIYDMYKASVTSRFAQFGKLVLLSFPRFEDDFIQQKYKDAIWGMPNDNGIRPMLGELEIVERTATLKVDPDLPDGTTGNEFEIKWDEDHIIRYAYPYTFALRRPSWEVNPTKDLQTDYALDFYRNPGDALGRFACKPSNLKDGFFKRMDKVENAFRTFNGVDGEGVFHPQFKPKEDTRYFMHVDLAQKHDNCAVAMGHIDQWVEYNIGSIKEYMPLVRIDAVRYWTPTKDKSVDFKEVIDYIKHVRREGFDLKLVTFDRWNCLTGEAIIHTPVGPVRMRDISVGDEVITRHGISKVGRKRDSGVQEVLRVTTRLGYEFEATRNHRMLTRRGWVTMGELTDEDELLLDNSYCNVHSDNITEQQAYALGRLVTSSGKTIPQTVLTGSDVVRAAFLAGYIDGDGSIQTYVDRSGTTRYRLTVDTISERLVEELVWLSMSLGLEPTRLRQKRRGSEREVHRLTFEGKKAERLLAIVKPSIDRKNSVKVTQSKPIAERWSFKNNQMWVKVRKIESIGEHQTYDISVPEYEEFIANGFVTHNSHDTMKDLERNGIKTATLSVGKKHYDDFLITMYDDRLIGPKVDLLIKELGELRQVVKGSKVTIDHPRKGSNDLSDAVCGAIWNSIAHTPKEQDLEADAMTLGDLRNQVRELDKELELEWEGYDHEKNNVIMPPKPKLDDAPKDVQDMVANLLRVL